MKTPPLGSILKATARGALRRFAPRLLVRRHEQRYGRDEIETSILDLIVPQGRDAIDVGANWGVYSRRLAPLCRQVFCFEPNPELASILRRTLPRNCVVEEAAASDGAGTGYLYMPVEGSRIIDGLASLRRMASKEIATVKVRTKPLDELADRPVGFIKIDVEGAEMSTLAGAEQIIARNRPLILVEIEERHRAGAIAEAHGWFTARGYEGWFVHRGQLAPVATFEPETMQNPQALDPTAPRNAQAYINNFLFAPKGAIDDALKERLRQRLATWRADA